jgi:hypothetical protein
MKGIEMKLRRTGLAATLLGLLLTTALTGSALADVTTPLNGNPLVVHVGERGQLQAFRSGSPTGIFYAPTNPVGDAGFFLAFPGGFTGDTTPRVFGFSGSAGPSGLDPYTPISQTPTTGAGTPSDPLHQVTTYGVSIDSGVTDILTVTQTTTYVNGSQSFHLAWQVHNASGNAVNYKALTAADFFFDGSDRGTGIYTDGPPRFIGGTNADTGNSGGFAEVTGGALLPWTSYQALAWGGGANQVWGKIEAAALSTAPTFDSTVVGESVDNAGGTEWDQDVTGGGLLAGGNRTYELEARSAVPSALQLTPPNGGSPRGVPINYTAVAKNTDGVPYAGKTLRYQITGVNPGAGSVVLNAAGSGTVTDPGANAGNDTVIAYVDFNNNGTRQPAEPQASALGTFVDSIAPTCTVKVSGDRPGGGGAGKPLVITVSCNEAATVTAATTLQTIPTARRSASASQKRKKKKAVKIKLKTTSAIVLPGQAFPVKVAISKKIRTKYAGKTLKAIIKVSARDASGNVKTVTATKKIKLAKIKKARKRR